MAKYIITGGNKLSGQVTISGNKNSILPCLAATLLTEEQVILKNVPQIKDVEVFLEILKSLGSSYKQNGSEITIQTKKLSTYQLDPDLTSKLRASVLLVGPILAKLGKVDFFHPGGDVIGKRSIDTHLDGFKALGFQFKTDNRHYRGFGAKKQHTIRYFLNEASVTATENLILTSVLGSNEITLKNCAKEPHVVDLCNLLNQMGALISGVGESTLKIKGVSSLHGTTFKIGADFIEIGTYAVAAAVTGGTLTLNNCDLTDLEPILNPLKQMGIEFETKGQTVKVSTNKILPIPKLTTNIWPGFPTDLMSIMIVLATQARGVSLLHDWMFESRMFFVDKLISMGANIIIADPHRVLVSGLSPLVARNLESPDIRAGMALVLAGLIASGESTINRVELIERGYGDMAMNLGKIGADIRRIPLD